MPTGKGFGSIFKDTLRRFKFQDAEVLLQNKTQAHYAKDRPHTAPADVPSHNSPTALVPSASPTGATVDGQRVNKTTLQKTTDVSTENIEDRSVEEAQIGRDYVKQGPIGEGHKEESLANIKPRLTDGESRVVLAFDGKHECAAILLTDEMVRLLSDISPQSRYVKKLEDKLKRFKREKLVQEMDVERERELVDDDSSRKQETETQGCIEEETKEDELQSKIEALEPELDMERSYVRIWQQMLTKGIISALKDGGLLESNEEESQDKDEREREGSSSTYEDETYSTKASTESMLSLEQLARRNARDDLHYWREQFLERSQNVEDRGEYYDFQWQRFQELKSEGHPITQTEFDHKMIINIGRMARELIEAEDAFETAKIAARKFDVVSAVNDFDQESDFFDQPDDSYRESFEAYMAESAPTHVIEPWLDHLLEEFPIIEGIDRYDELQDEKGNGESNDEIWQDECEPGCDWEVRSVGFASSIGALADGVSRKKIDRWHIMCGLDSH